MPYFILPKDDSDFEIDPTILSDKLHKQWPMIRIIQNVPNPEIILEWEIIAGNINHLGTLYSDKRSLVIDDYPIGVAEFAIWYKKFFAENHDIYIYHDSDANLEIKITGETKVTDIQDLLEGNFW